VSADFSDQEIPMGQADSLNQISSDGLVIFQVVNGSYADVAEWGQVLDYQVHFRNATSAPWPDLALEISVDKDLVDATRSSFGSGSFDAARGVVRFDKNNTSRLALLNGGQEGFVSFSLALVQQPPARTQKNFVFKTVASIKSEAPDLESEPLAAQDVLNLKIRTKASLLSKGYYKSQYFAPIGAIPPKVGLETGYTFIWQLSNNANDLTGVRVSAHLGPHVAWTGSVFPKDAPVRYDENQQEVVWDVGNLNAGTGMSYPARQVAFQVLFTPSADQAGQLGLLLGQAKLTGTDAFASSTTDIFSMPIYTDIPDDPTAQGQGTISQ
jgi:hypothetical protein